ncbi:T3SS effector EspK [Xenorhabdus beddingii]|uniref:T3SS effector EspK n=1 Tax=Xenorhabdus beddingii TaxID=40578 RepID=A0A1Y2SQB4_9GAMM|nr:hypothetical protein [Xenorhabdus beddingii]OTA21274.1 T3SS effector EspK [Xenorhabdus beddingii]
MPFHRPFKTCVETGDLIFGLSHDRLEYWKNHPLFSPFSAPNITRSIDQFSLNRNEIEIQQSFGKKIPLMQRSFEEATRNHPKYSAILDPKINYYVDSKKQRVMYHPKVVNRKCKAGLFWMSHSSSNACIHFILDSINMEHVVIKYYEKQTDIKYSVTGSELRWIYRNRRDLKVQASVQFWRNKEPVSAPWEEGEYVELWRQYHPKSENLVTETVELEYIEMVTTV